MKVIKNSTISAGTGVIAQIASEVISPTNTDYALYGMLAAGIILPEVVKGNEMVEIAGQSLVAIAGYKISEDYDFVTKLGLGKSTAVTTTGLNDVHAVGKPGGWSPRPTYQAQKVNGKAEKTGSAVM